MVRIVAAMALVFGLLVMGSTAATAQEYGGETPTTLSRNPPGGGNDDGGGNGGGAPSRNNSGPLARTGSDLIVPLAATGTVVAGVGALCVVAAHQRRRSLA
jgi:hypothetical protein